MHEIVALLGSGRVTAVLLLSTRIAALLLLTPILYAVAIPPVIRVLMVLGIACVLAMPFGASVAAMPTDTATLFSALLREAAIGATLGLGVLLAFAGFHLAGHLVDVQVGFGMAHVFDPATRSRVPVLSALFGLLAAVFFFLVEGHHALLRGVAYSLERFPLGQAWEGAAAVEPMLREVTGLFALGFALAAPVVLTLLLVEVALGVAARNLPQMNLLLLGMPVKILVGLLALTLWAGGFAAPASRLYAAIYEAWTSWFAVEVRR